MADVDFDAITAALDALPDDEDTPERLRKRIATIDAEQAIRREHREWLVETLKRADQELAYWCVERQRLRARLPDGDGG